MSIFVIALVVLFVVLAALIIGILLTPIMLWVIIKSLNSIANLFCDIANPKHKEINCSKHNIEYIYLRNYGFRLGPFQIGVHEPIYYRYITYLNNRGNNNLKNHSLNMVFKPLTQYISNPIKEFIHHADNSSTAKESQSTRRKQNLSVHNIRAFSVFAVCPIMISSLFAKTSALLLKLA